MSVFIRSLHMASIILLKVFKPGGQCMLLSSCKDGSTFSVTVHACFSLHEFAETSEKSTLLVCHLYRQQRLASSRIPKDNTLDTNPTRMRLFCRLQRRQAPCPPQPLLLRRKLLPRQHPTPREPAAPASRPLQNRNHSLRLRWRAGRPWRRPQKPAWQVIIVPFLRVAGWQRNFLCRIHVYVEKQRNVLPRLLSAHQEGSLPTICATSSLFLEGCLL